MANGRAHARPDDELRAPWIYCRLASMPDCRRAREALLEDMRRDNDAACVTSADYGLLIGTAGLPNSFLS
jgi:hypothetical protein